MKKYNIIPEKVGLINSVKSPFVDKEIEEYLAKGNGVYCRCAAPKKHKNPVRDLRTGFQNSGFEVKCSKVVPKRLLLLFYFPQKVRKNTGFLSKSGVFYDTIQSKEYKELLLPWRKDNARDYG